MSPVFGLDEAERFDQRSNILISRDGEGTFLHFLNPFLQQFLDFVYDEVRREQVDRGGLVQTCRTVVQCDSECFAVEQERKYALLVKPEYPLGVIFENGVAAGALQVETHRQVRLVECPHLDQREIRHERRNLHREELDCVDDQRFRIDDGLFKLFLRILIWGRWYRQSG